jgi:DNA-binding transcriptional ArsR family regulator
MTIGLLETERVFDAIAHPLRRRLLDRLLEGDRPVKELTAGLDVSRPAISQHLRVLLDAGLVVDRREGRQRYYHVQAERLRGVRDWLRQYERFAQLERWLDEPERAV